LERGNTKPIAEMAEYFNTLINPNANKLVKAIEDIILKYEIIQRFVDKFK